MTNYINEGFRITNDNGEEEIIQIPYNINNILITEQDIINLLNNYNVKIEKVNNLEIFHCAFTHKSYCKKDIYPEQVLIDAKRELGNDSRLVELRDKSYERLEYLGDRVLKLFVSLYLYNRYPDEQEGFMTRLQTKIEDKNNLAILCKEMGLSKYFIISKHIESIDGRNSDRIHEDIFESFLGALCLSNGLDACLLLITNLLETLIDYSEKLYCDNNYKDILLRHHHNNEWLHPKYEVIYFEGPPHKRKYIVGVFKNKSDDNCNKENKYIGYGIGNSHKEGEQNAAKMALIIYGILNSDQYIDSDIFYPDWNIINNENIENKINIMITKNTELKVDETDTFSDKSI